MNQTLVKTSLSCLLVAGVILIFVAQPAAAQRKTAEELNQIRAALVSPSQKGVNVDSLTEQEMQTATLQQEGTKGYTLKNEAGVTIRTLFDTDGDGQLDQWGFYKDGVEVYRDLDTDGDKMADQMRWLNTCGTRWGVDTNKDGIIDSWKVISPEEVSEEVTLALATRDINRFMRVALTADELKSLQCGPEMTKKFEATVAQQQQAFQQAVQEISLSGNAQWAQFSALKPATIPAGTNGNAKDMTIYYDAITSISEGEKTVYIQLGSMIKLGDVWKVVEAPFPYGSGKQPFISPGPMGDSANPEMPEEIRVKVEEILSQEEKLSATPQADRASIYDRIIVLRLEVATLYANKYKDPVNRDKWLRDLADFIYTAVTVDAYSSGLSKLQTISKSMKDSNNHEVAAYMQYRTVEATYIAAQSEGSQPGRSYSNRIDGLKQLVIDFPNTTTAAQVQLELVGEYEMSNQFDEAKKAAQAVISTHPNTLMAKKAAGYLRRMDAVGKAFPFQGTSSTGSTININQYNGKIVLLYFWASWSDPTGEEAAAMKRIQALFERDGLSIIGVNMDEKAEDMQAYVTQHATKWPNIHEPGGQDSRPAVDAGVNVPPFFILIDKEGKVVNNQLLTPRDVDLAVLSLVRGE